VYFSSLLSDVVLCGHSYGGIVATGVADAIPEKLVAVVYLDAYIPDDGDCVMDFMGEQRKASLLRALNRLLKFYQTASSNGDGSLDFSSVIKLYRRRTDVLAD
jgi:pimeloyl-ACP methyl ester carboxylesterase